MILPRALIWYCDWKGDIQPDPHVMIKGRIVGTLKEMVDAQKKTKRQAAQSRLYPQQPPKRHAKDDSS